MPRAGDNDAEDAGEASLGRELYFFNLYRLLEAGLFAFAAFSPLAGELAEIRHPALAQAVATGYSILAFGLLWLGRTRRFAVATQAGLGLSLDLLAAAAALHALVGLSTGISLLLVFNVGAGALLLPLRAAMVSAVTAAVVVLGQHVLGSLLSVDARPLAEAVMFAATYLATAIVTHLLGREMRASHALAQRRGAEAANMARINELIIRRMRTGLLVIDAENRIQLFNEAAWHLLGNPPPERRSLGEVAPELSRRLWHWLNGRAVEPTPVALAEDAPETIPRFIRLSTQDELVLVFLEDSAALSRRAEQMTLSTLGRLSASIAHEIRNPLTAISYSAQLLAECETIPETDLRLVEIINTQCQRMNGIVQSILSMARRERAQPESLELGRLVREFVDEYRSGQPLGEASLYVSGVRAEVLAMADPRHLHQVLSALVDNALRYGRLPDRPARVTLSVGIDEPGASPCLEVIDRGPGIPPKVAESIFEPFFSTSEHGTGLGLYIARQLCEANQADLSYHSLPGGGSCFRILLSKGQTLGREG